MNKQLIYGLFFCFGFLLTRSISLRAGDINENKLLIVEKKRDLGVVMLEEIVYDTIFIKNISEATLDIQKIYQKSCGCPAGQKDGKYIIEPGKSVALEMKLDTSGERIGRNVIDLVAITSDKQIIAINNVAEYFVRKDILVPIQPIRIGTSEPNEPYNTKFELTINATPPPVFGVTSDSKDIEIAVEQVFKNINTEKEKSNFNFYTIHINGKAPKETGDFRHVINLHFKDFMFKNRLFQVAIEGHVSLGVQPSPNYIFLGYISSNKIVTKNLTLHYGKNKVVKIKSVKTSGGLLVNNYSEQTKQEGALGLSIDFAVKEKTTEIPDEKIFCVITGELNHEPFDLRIPCYMVN